eukprot:Clim_evm230s157 gene=Clim_evmTU230s157
MATRNHVSVGLRLSGRVVGVYGTGVLAASRVNLALQGGVNRLTVFMPPAAIVATEMKQFLESGRVEFSKEEISRDALLSLGVQVLFVAEGDQAQQQWLARVCNDAGILVTAPLAADSSDFILPSVSHQGRLEVTVSTKGSGCSLAARIRRDIEKLLPTNISSSIEKYASMRDAIRAIEVNENKEMPASTFLRRIAESWSYDDLAKITAGDIEELKVHYLEDVLPSSLGVSRALTQQAQHTRNEEEQSGCDDKILAAHGEIWLVGAGPGSPGLLTMAAREVLDRADLVLADKLIPKELINTIKCEIKFAQKYPGRADKAQNELHEWGLQALKQGKTVVRLKGGDPFVFGRGGEEIVFFREHGYEAKVIAGVTSAFAAPLAANIPVTHRGIADQVLVLTGRGREGTLPEIPQYHAKRTLVFLMGIERLGDLSQRLISELGFPNKTPAAVVQKATWGDQQEVFGTLEDIHQKARDAVIISPAAIIVGGVCNALQTA